MKKSIVLLICLLPLIFSCTSKTQPPDVWEYAPSKWVSFKKEIDLSWGYDNSKIDYFEIDREMVKLDDGDMKEIIQLVDDQNSKELLNKEKKYRDRVIYDNVVTKYPAKDLRSFKDKIKPRPTFGQIYFYQMRAVKHPQKGQPEVVLRSEPAAISVMIVRKPK